MARVAVVGVGAIGGYFAAQLFRSGHDLSLCVRTPFDRLVVESGEAEQRVEAPVLTRPEQAVEVDWVFLATKAHQSAEAGDWLSVLCGPETRGVVVMQNGVEQVERVTPLVGTTAVIPAIVLCGAEALAPGHIRHHGYSELKVPAGALSAELEALFEGSEAKIAPQADFVTELWRKLLQNAVASPITALSGCRLGVFRRADVQVQGAALAEECVAVARAAGASLGPQDAGAVLEGLAAVAPEMGSSMLYDRMAGRPLEHDAITGAVVRFGERFEIATPVSRSMLALLAANSAAAERRAARGERTEGDAGEKARAGRVA